MYLKVLKNPTIRRLSIVQIFVYFGAWFSNVAIYTMVLKFDVSPLLNSLVVVMYALPGLLAPINGAIVDKMPFKKFMLLLMFVELTMTLMYLSIHSISQIYLLMLFIFIRTLSAFLFFIFEMSLLPQIVKGDELRLTNELHSMIWAICYALGMAIGGLSVHYLGIYNTILVDAGLFVIAILLFYTIKIDVKKVSEHSLVKLIKDGFFYLKEHKLMIHLIILHALVAFTSFDALINLLADYEYKEIIAIPLAIGWLNAVRAFGLVIGPLFIGKIIDHTNLHKIFFLQGVVVIVWAFVQKDFYMSILSMVFIGFFTTTLWSYTYTLIQTHTQKEFLGRVVAYNDMIFMSVSILVSIFIGVAYKSGVSLQMISFTLGFGFIVGGIYYMWFKNRYHDFLESKSD